MSGGPLLFLSHSGADTEPARELKRRLLASPEAKAANLAVWFDKDDLVPGNWQEQLEDAIARRSTAFAVVVGTKGVVNWVDREVPRPDPRDGGQELSVYSRSHASG